VLEKLSLLLPDRFANGADRNRRPMTHSFLRRLCSSQHVLLVEPDAAARAILHTAASAFAHVESQSGFDIAHSRLKRGVFDFLVTNLRLNAYNGLQLVTLRSSGPGTPRAIVYTDKRDPGLGRQVQRAGAFYETRESLPVTLAAYLRGTLPDRDRRDPAIPDRRGRCRGGRRCWDLHLVRQVH
jgi:CheY-like chemotaxis protein